MLQTPLFGAYNRLLKLDSWSRQTNHQLIVSYCGQSQFTCGEGSLARARNSSAGPEGRELMDFLTALFFTPLFDLAANSVGSIYTPVFLPEEFHRQGLQRVGHMTEPLTLSLSTYRFNLHNHQLDILL